MTQNKRITNHISIANQDKKADLVIKNARITDVFNLEVFEGDVAITDGFIVGIGSYEGKETLDAEGRYMCPGFIDGHVHIESSMLPPSEFEKVVLPHGVTSVITDPHEIANVSGTDGLDFMIKNSEGLTLDAFIMLPSCVPATPFEHAGATLLAGELRSYLAHPRVLGLAEMMDYPSLRQASPDVIDKLTMQTPMKIDGHLAGLDTNAINVYRAAGIDTDHECKTAQEAIERVRRGMYVMIREGSVSKDLSSLIQAVTPSNVHRFLFCTDDKHIDDLLDEGSIDHNIRLAIQQGIPPLQAIQMATLNAARCYGLTHKGAIAPGYAADFVLLDDLKDVTISDVYKGGERVTFPPSSKGGHSTAVSSSITNTISIPEINEVDLQIPIDASQLTNVIEIIPNNLVTHHVSTSVDAIGGSFQPSTENDLLKVVVVERHHKTGHIGVGIVKGFRLAYGAIATTIAHDSHNIVAVGTNDEDILAAIQSLQTINGGLTVVREGKTLSSVSLSIAGLMSIESFETVYHSLKEVKHSLQTLGFRGSFNPFLTLSFLTLPVIPSLKITDMGLFDVNLGQHIPIQSAHSKSS